MRSRSALRFWATCLILLAWASSAQALESLLVALPGEVRPIALWESETGQFRSPPRTQAAQQLLGASLNKTRFSVYDSGEERNQFNARRFQTTPAKCTGSGAWKGQYRTPLKQAHLAFTPGFPGVRSYVGSFPGKIFEKQALKLTLKAYRGHGVKSLNQLKILKLQGFTLNNGLRKLFAVQSEIRGAGACPDHTLLLIGEKVGRSYRTVLERYRRNQNDCGRYFFLGSFATTMQVDKIAVMGQQDNARWYDLFHFPTGKPAQQIFHGGGHQCLAQS